MLFVWTLSLVVIVVTVLFSGRALSYGLPRLLRLLLPSLTQDCHLELKPLSLLRVQDCTVIFKRGVLKFRDFRLFREFEWYRTFISWFFEGAFPIALTGIELQLNVLPFLERSVNSTPLSLKKRRQLKLPRWIWRFLFKALSRVLINILDLTVTLVDLGISIHLKQVTVLFKSDAVVPCRAAMKAKDLRLVFTSREHTETMIEAFEFLQLTDIAATTSVVIQRCQRGFSPVLNSVKIALGDMEVTLIEALIEGGIDVLQLMSKQRRISSSGIKTKRFIKTENLDKMLTKGFPQKLGLSFHQLTVHCPELESLLLIKNLHMGMESTENDHLEIKGGIVKSEVKLGIIDKQQGLLVEVPCIGLSSQVGYHNNSIKFCGKVEIRAVQISVNDCLIWQFLQKLNKYILAYSGLRKTGSEDMEKKALASSSETASLPPCQKSESLNSDESEPIYGKVLDSTDLGILQIAEEEEFFEEIAPQSDAPLKEKRIHPLIECAAFDWDLSLAVPEALNVQLISPEQSNSIIMELQVSGILLEAKLNREGKTKSDCMCGFAFKSLSVRSDDSVLSECVRMDEIKAKCDALMEIVEKCDEGFPCAFLTLNSDLTIHGLVIKSSHTKLQKLLTLFVQMSDKFKSHTDFSVTRLPKQRRQKSKALTVQLKQWKGKAVNLKLEHEMEISPVQEYWSKTDSPLVTVLIEISNVVAESGAEITECNVQLTNLSTIVDYHKENEKITFLAAHDLLLQAKKQMALTAIQVSGSKVRFDAEIDLAIIILQLMEDSKLLLSQSKNLQSSSSSESSSSGLSSISFNLDRPQSSSMSGVPVRVPSTIHTKMRNFILDIKAIDLTGHLRISESDTISVKISETTVVTRKQNPRICFKHLMVEMNDSRILECIHVKLRVIGPCYLTELIQAQGAEPTAIKRKIDLEEREASFNRFMATSSSNNIDGSQEPLPEASQTQKWRIEGCNAMGISEYVEEDYSGDGSVLDFFSIDINAETICFMLPHNENLGRLVLFTELWIEAVKDVIKGKLPKRTLHNPSGKTNRKDGPADLIEICLSVKRVVFRLDPHPLEVWLGLHGMPLQETMVLRHAWENTVKGLHEDLEANTRDNASQWINKAVFQDYRSACDVINEAKKDLMFHNGALMSIVAQNVDALILIGDKKSPNIIKATTQRIKELDHPISDDITFARMQPIYIAASATDVKAHFDGLEKPSAVVRKLEFNGLIARGRQLTHNPKLVDESYQVGRWHIVTKQLPMKGARPPMKTYTNLEARVYNLEANGGIGLESVFCQLSKAFNRLIPPSQVNSNGTLPEFSGHTLQTWDKIRYIWRGQMKVNIHGIQAAVAANLNKFVDVQTPRLELQAERLDANVIAGHTIVEAKDLKITLFSPGLRSSPEAALHDFPLCIWPQAKIEIQYKWTMPQNRNPLLHYAFPVVTTPDPGVLLDPVDLFELFVGEGYSLEIRADLESRLDPDQIPKIIMGEAQIRFLVEFFKLMEDAPVMVRGCWKRGTYFVRKDKRKKCITPELPNLLHRITAGLTTPKLAVEHHVWESEDPSDQLLITCEEVSFNGTWAFLNKIEDACALREGRFVKKSRYQEVNGVWRQVKGKIPTPDMEDLAVSAVKIEGFLPETHATHPILTRESPDNEVDSELLNLLSSHNEATKERKEEDSLMPPDGRKGRILTAKGFKLKQRSKRMTDPSGDVHVLMPNGEIKRPLHIQLSDVRVLMPLEVRNAVLGVYMHMFSAFIGPPKPSSNQKQTINLVTSESKKEQLEVSEKSEKQSSDAELLKTLLMQDAQGTGPRSPHELKQSLSTSHETPQVDPPPSGSKMILQMEFHHVQLSCLSNVSMGGVLVCLENGLLFENFSEEQQIRSMGLQVHQVQAYHMDTQIDPMNPIRWLEPITGGMLTVPNDSRDMLSLILQPFEAELSDLHLMMSAQARNPGRAAEELKIHSSMIEATTNSEQFEMLVDVINSVATPSTPDIKLMNDNVLGPTGSALEDTSREISDAKEMLKDAYREFNDLRNEAYQIRVLASTDHSSKLVLTRNKAEEFLQGIVFGQDKLVSCRSSLSLVQSILNEQIEVAAKVCYKSACTLKEIRKHVEVANKHKKLYKSMDMQLSIEKVIWRLINKNVEFMLAQISRVFFKSFQNKDLSGESKVSVYRIELRDSKGIVGPESGLESGVVLSVLEPSDSDEEVLRGLAIRGSQTSSHVYYEHIEGWVHRFGLNFNEAIAMEIAAFFFPSDEDEIVRKHEEKWAKFADNRQETETEIESPEKEIMRESLTDTSFEIRTRASSFLEPLFCVDLPQHRPSFSDGAQILPDVDPLTISFKETSRKKRRKKKGLAKSRKIQFVHVRFNKVVAHVTYTGRPFSFHGLTLTLGTSEYNSLEGSWRGLFKKYRNGIIGSVIKSIASHESCHSGSKKDKSATSRILGKGRKLFHRKDKTTPTIENEDEDEMAVDVLDEEEGRNLLLGKM
eukprot:g1897.t1